MKVSPISTLQGFTTANNYMKMEAEFALLVTIKKYATIIGTMVTVLLVGFPHVNECTANDTK